MAKKPTVKKVKAVSAKSVKAPTKAPKKAVQVKISVKPIKNPMIGEKAMPMMPSGKKSAGKSTPGMMKQAKTAVVKPNKEKK